MKKQLTAFLILMTVLLSSFSANAQKQVEPDWYVAVDPGWYVAVEPSWYVLDEQQKVLTITLPANATTGYEWTYEISDPEALELMNVEYVLDGSEFNLVGTGGTWLADFNGIFKDEAEVELTLNYKRAWEDEAIQTRLVKLKISENNQLEVIFGDIVFGEDECIDGVCSIKR